MNSWDNNIFRYDLPVEFAGLTSTMGTLYANGWQMMQESQPHDRSIIISMRHHGLELHAITDEFDIMRYSQNISAEYASARHYQRGYSPLDSIMAPPYPYRPRLRIQVIGKDIHMNTNYKPDFRRITSPLLNVRMDIRTMSLSQLPWFDTEPVQEEGKIIYVDDANVTDLMNIILEKQAPKQAEIRERLRKEENRSRIIKPEANIVRLFA